MSSLGIYRNSENEFVCEYCNISPFINLQDALDHVENMHKVYEPEKIIDTKPEIVPIPKALPSEINEYYNDLEKGGTMQAAERLMMSLIEDYTLSRNADLREKSKPGPMTLNLGKVAAEAMINYNKLKTISKSVNLNFDANKKTDIDALKDILNNKNNNDNTTVDNENDDAK